MRKLILISICILTYGFSIAQPTIVFIKNGSTISPPYSISKSDILLLKIKNPNPSIKYQIANIRIGIVADGTYEQIQQREKNTNYTTVTADINAIFKQEPEVQIDVQKLIKNKAKQLIIIINEIREKSGKANPSKSSNFTYGKEYLFWIF